MATQDRWLTLPNAITAARILFATPLLFLLYIWERPLSAFFVLLAAAISDYIDGYLARAWNMKSSLGEFLDPAADKVLCLTVLAFALAHYGPVFWLFMPIFVIALYDFSATIMRLAGIIPKTSKIAKWKTAVLMTSLLIFFLALHFEPSQSKNEWLYAFMATLWIAGIMTAISGYNYVITGRRVRQ